MHGLVDAAHVDHLHPDSGIAIATAADGEQLTKDIFGDEVVWVPWRRPGFQLGLDIAAIHDANPEAVGVILGGHGITAWGATSDEAEANSPLDHRDRAGLHRRRTATPQPFGAVGRRARAAPDGRAPGEGGGARAAPARRSRRSDHRMVGHFTDTDVVLEFLAGEKLFALAELGTSCPDHFLRTKVKPLVLDLPADGADRGVRRPARASCTTQYRADYARLLRAPRRRRTRRPMRGADPAIILVPGVGMFSYGKDKQTARVAGEFYVNAINVMRGAEAVSTYAPIPEREKFRIEYWALEEAKLQRLPAAEAPRRPHRARHRRGERHRQGDRRRGSPPTAPASSIADLDARHGAAPRPPSSGGADVADRRRRSTSPTPTQVAGRGRRHRCSPSAASTSSSTTPGCRSPSRCSRPPRHDWDLQHDVMAKGSFLVAQAAARAMIDQRPRRRHRLHRRRRTPCSPGPNNIAYSAAKADQAHQVRLLAAELGEHGIRVNGVNPDGVVRGSGIFAGGWGAQRAAVYGVPEEELGAFYAQRTLLKREVLPEHVANAVAAHHAPTSSATPPACIVPVDAGVAAAFLR